MKTERQTREKLANLARRLGIFEDFKRIVDRYDVLLRHAKSPVEKRQIQIMANVEVHKLFDFRNALIVDGEVILPATIDEDKIPT